MRKAIIGVAVGVVLGLSATVAVAAIPDGQGVIHACRSIKSGTLRVIDTDAGQSCTKTEQSLSWNQTGPAGPAGPPGLSGTFLRNHGGYDQPIELPALPGTGRSEAKELVKVTIPEIESGNYLMTARLQGIDGPAGAVLTCGAFGGFEDPKAGVFADSGQVGPGGVIKLQSIMGMFDDWAPIVLQCTATGLGDDDVLRLREFHFALIRIS